MCIKREPHEILQPVADLVAEVPLMLTSIAGRRPMVQQDRQTPHRATNGTFPGLAAYFATMENL